MLIASRVRRLIEKLPGPANWIAWVKFVILQTGTYKTFLQHCLSNTRSVAQLRRQRHGIRNEKFRRSTQDKTPLAHALSWEQLAQRHHRIITYLYLYLLIKYQMVKLISEPYGYLDCLIMGRFRFIGRMSIISGDIASVILLNFLANRYAIHLLLPKFKFYALEFLMASHEEVLSTELAMGGPGQPSSSADKLRDQSESKSKDFQIYRRWSKHHEANKETSACPGAGVDSSAHLQSPFDINKGRWILRLNRTADCWLKLTLWTKFMIYYAVCTLICSSVLMYWMFAGSVLTNSGFELGYPSCAAWLRLANQNQSAHKSNHSHIYLASRVLARKISIDELPARIPLDTRDLPRLTWYTVLRISADIIENHVIYLESMLLFATLSYILAISSIDVVHNANAIKARLLRLLERLEERLVLRHHEQVARAGCYPSSTGRAQRDNTGTYHHQVARPDPITTLPDWTFGRVHRIRAFKFFNLSAAETNSNCHLHDEITELQALLVDHFCTITRGNNLFVSFLLAVMGLFWLLYTVTVCIWMSSIRSRAIELEFVLAEMSVTLLCLALMVGAALVRSHNLQLHNLITRAMALDPDWSLTKPRWMTILKYFYPKPFHCFTIFGSTEISGLLGLEILSWILSVFIVLANFFYANRFA